MEMVLISVLSVLDATKGAEKFINVYFNYESVRTTALSVPNAIKCTKSLLMYTKILLIRYLLV